MADIEALEATKRGNRKRVVSLDVDVCTFESAVERISGLVRAGNGGYVCLSTVHMVMEAYDDPEFADIVNAADLVIPDGMPLYWTQRIEGAREGERIRGNDLMLGLLAQAESEDLTVGFYGSTEETLEIIGSKVSEMFPRLRVAFSYSPPFRPLDDAEAEAIRREIKLASPDILFVGLGCPKQERWMRSSKESLSAVMVGVGAAFDFFAGHLAECPRILSIMGLEWLFRLYQEPRRLWSRYLYHNPRFVVLAMKQVIFGKKRGSQ